MIVGVAIMFQGTLYTLPKPNRHYDIIKMLRKEFPRPTEDTMRSQGFVDDKGKFLSRRRAYDVAVESGQLVRKQSKNTYQGDMLFSEDVW